MLIIELLPQICTTFFCALLTVKFMQPVAVEIGLVDKPCLRKKHSGNIPLIGGISIFVAVLIATTMWLPNTQELRMYLISSSMIVFIGALDDKYDLSVRVRIVGQVIVASIMIFGVGTYISELGDLFAFGQVNIGAFGILFTYLSILVLINAFNMIDGLDGLLGTQALITLGSIAILFLFNGAFHEFNFPLILSVAILPYLAFNLGLIKNAESKKIYMGDAGSMFIGLSVIWILSIGTQGESASFSPVIALWITAVPLMDMLAIIIRRVKKGNSPFKPDREHLHHICIKSGLSAKQTLCLISTLSLVLSIIGITGQVNGISDNLMLLFFIFTFIIYSRVLKYTSLKLDGLTK